VKLTLPIFFILFSLVSATEKLELHFFGANSCEECHELKMMFLEPYLSDNNESVNITFHDIDEPDQYQTLTSYESSYEVTHGAYQQLYFPDTTLQGVDEIESHTDSLVQHYLTTSDWHYNSVNFLNDEEFAKYIQNKARGTSFWAIVSLGLLDGVNPCAIATMIFLISFLTANKRSRKEILIIGLSYTATVFVTYTAIGAVVFKSISSLEVGSIFSLIIKWIAIVIAGGVGIYSLIDAYNFSRSKNVKSIKLQLPNSIKKQIHKVINGNMKQSNLIIGTIVTGFLVTILETFCTGQTYLPAIQAMVTDVQQLDIPEELRKEIMYEGWYRLLFYNFLFVLPLLLVMIAAYFGLTWNRLAKATQSNMVLLKVLLGVVMIALALYLGLS